MLGAEELLERLVRDEVRDLLAFADVAPGIFGVGESDEVLAGQVAVAGDHEVERAQSIWSEQSGLWRGGVSVLLVAPQLLDDGAVGPRFDPLLEHGFAEPREVPSLAVV